MKEENKNVDCDYSLSSPHHHHLLDSKMVNLEEEEEENVVDGGGGGVKMNPPFKRGFSLDSSMLQSVQLQHQQQQEEIKRLPLLQKSVDEGDICKW